MIKARQDSRSHVLISLKILMFTDTETVADGDGVGTLEPSTYPPTGHPLGRDAATQELGQRCEGGWRSMSNIPPLEVIRHRFVIVVVTRDGVHGTVLVSTHVSTHDPHTIRGDRGVVIGATCEH